MAGFGGPLALCLSLVVPPGSLAGGARTGDRRPGLAPASERPALTRSDLEAWLDGYLPAALERNDMAGVVVVVVKDGAVLLQKGYGYADVAARKPIDPNRTVFPIASISKTFTGTAVMQLVERGELDLDRDVNDYLDFAIPPAFGRPITLRHLLTHTAGFDDLQKGSSPADPGWYFPLDVYLRRRSPNRIFAPGDTPAYSNYGIALAAYIVQRVSGEPIEEYFQRHIFAPLGMRRTSAYQPTPAPLIDDRAQAYRLGSGEVQRTEFTNARGAGGIASTGADMARYMIAHLHQGQYGEVRILEPETARQMHARTMSPVDRINGMAITFFEEDYNGERIIGHDGDTKGVHSNLKLLLDRNVGLFVDFNASGIGNAVYDLRDRIFYDLVDRYFPARTPDEPTVPTAVEHAKLVTGPYQSSRRLNGVLSVFMMLNGFNVSANSDGTLAIPMPPSGRLRRYHEIAPFLWREVGGKELLQARVRDGRVVSLHNHPVGVFLAVPHWRSAEFNLPLLAASIVVWLIAVIGWAVAGWNRAFRPRSAAVEWAAGWTDRLARVGALCMLLFLAGWVFLAINLMNRFYLFNAGLDPWLRLLQLVGLVGVVGAGAALWNAWRAFRTRTTWRRRLGAATLAATLVWMVWFTFTFDLITATLDY